MEPSLKPMVVETLDRTRRIETRLTKYLEQTGFDTGIQRPTWGDGKISVPTPACSLRDCLAVVPSDWPVDEEIEIFVGDDKQRLMSIFIG